MTSRAWTLSIGLAVAASFASAASAQITEYSPHAHEDFPMQVLWGDTHVHSSFSMDANTTGNTKLTPADAYRFARGEPVQAHNGMTARLDVPLDFLVVSDHAEYMGILPKLRAGDRDILRDPYLKRLSDSLTGDPDAAVAAIGELIDSLNKNEPLFSNENAQRSIWKEITKLADEHDDPGRFSALIGFEWTSTPRGDNLHRVVIYADDAARAGRKIPVSAFDGNRPEDLWAFMEAYEAETGGRILAIPHNANLSNGLMFAVEDSNGKPFDAAYTARRARHEPLAEVTQIKGDGETHSFLSPDDEFADFETWDHGNLAPRPLPKTKDMLQYEYARSALKLGLEQEALTGTNPFKFGMIGSTDAHTSLATAAEDDYWGKLTLVEPGTSRITGGALDAGNTADDDDFGFMPWQFVASGYAGVWAHENTRESIFAAMRRKEVYATSGPRITVRFFGGWSFEDDDALRPHAARIGYRKGVPMGGDLPAIGEAPSSRGAAPAPRFLVQALKDPQGANLDRIQIVKGWRDADGTLHEKVHDVALSGGRKAGWLGKIPSVGSTLDIENATYTNSIGAAELGTVWRDPDFDPQARAFYYARVIEIPKPRWTAYDVKRLGERTTPETRMSLQDRAYTSPIWYTP